MLINRNYSGLKSAFSFFTLIKISVFIVSYQKNLAYFYCDNNQPPTKVIVVNFLLSVYKSFKFKQNERLVVSVCEKVSVDNH